MDRLIARGRVGRPIDEVAALLAHQPSDWFQPFLRIAAHLGDVEGVALAQRLGHVVPHGDALHHVEITTRLRHRSLGDRISVAFRWRTSGYHTLFATLEGSFILRGAGSRTEILVEGREHPSPAMADPLGTLVCRRTAGTATGHLLVTLCTGMEAQTRAAVPSPATL